MVPTVSVDLTAKTRSYEQTIHFEQDTMTGNLQLAQTYLGMFSDNYDRLFWDYCTVMFNPKPTYGLLMPHADTQSNDPIGLKVAVRGSRIRDAGRHPFFD